MRPLSLATASCVIAAFLSAAPALAEQKGWVDPPAKPAHPNGAGTQAAKPDAAKSNVTGSNAAASNADDPAEPAPATTARTPRIDGPSRRGRLAERRERREERRAQDRRHDRTLAASGRPPMHFAPAGEGADARGSSSAGMAGAARQLAGSYLASISSPNAATLAQTPRFYGSQVRFHGRSMSTAALVAEKRRFFRRWPERAYAPQDGSMRTACDAGAATCTVRTVMGFRASNPARGARSLGLSELVLTVSFAGPRPVIVAESSRVLRRGAAASSAADHGRSGGA